MGLAPDGKSMATRLFDVGILDDGTLYNPRGYPDDLVHSAVLAADARRHVEAEPRRRRRRPAANGRRKRSRKLLTGYWLGTASASGGTAPFAAAVWTTRSQSSAASAQNAGSTCWRSCRPRGVRVAVLRPAPHELQQDRRRPTTITGGSQFWETGIATGAGGFPP
jgi:hypothetical protein